MLSVCRFRGFSGQGKWSVRQITPRTFRSRSVTWLARQLLAFQCNRHQVIEGRWSSTQHVCGHSKPHRSPRWRGFSTHLRSVGDWNAQHTRFHAYSNIFAGLTEFGVRLKLNTPATFRFDFVARITVSLPDCNLWWCPLEMARGLNAPRLHEEKIRA